jgi:cobalt/nickel transport system permease protein
VTHQWHDTFRHVRTPAHHLDPRTKLSVGVLFVMAVLSHRSMPFALAASYTAVLFAAAALAGIAWRPLLLRLAAVVPFLLLLLISTWMSASPLRSPGATLTKALLSIGAMAIVSSTTPFPDVLRALQQCRAPRLLVLFLAFLYRYGAVMGKEVTRVERGWTARYFGRRWGQQWHRLGHVLAAMLIRSYERAERVYAAMLARGFSTDRAWVHVLHFSVWDGVFASVSLALLAFLQWGPLA